MTEPKPPDEILMAVTDWRMVLLAFALGAIVVAVAVEIMHRSLPEHHPEE